MFEFAVSGMTCVACTSSIERLMHNEFDSRKMISVSMVLLTNKMFCTFAADVLHDKIVTPEMICEEVEMIGFDCALLSIAEMKGDQQMAKTKEAFGDDRSDSIDSDVMS
jgi:copper chaperone CopZ